MVRTMALAILFTFSLTGLLTNMSTATDVKAGADDEARAFIAEHEKTVRPLEREAALAWWNANVTGRDEDFQAKEESQNRLDAALSNRERFARLKAIKESPIRDPIVARQIAVLYLIYLEKQVDPELLRDHRQGQRHREGVQCLPRERERPEDDRQRGAQGPQGIA